MNRASFSTGDRVWRMPLWNYYSNHMKSKQFFFETLVVTKFVYLFILFILESATADLNNISAVAGGGSCTAAAFLKVSFHLYFLKFILLTCDHRDQPGFESSICYDHNKCRFQVYSVCNW